MKNVEDIYPLSPMQRGMLFHALLEPEEGAYLTQTSCEIVGDLDFPSFQAAWQQVLERHSILRTGFLSEGLDEPMQVVRRKVKFTLVHEDWRDSSVEEQDRRFQEFMEEDFRRGFDLRKPPLIRLALFRTEEGLHRCLWTMHHILMDGWCVGILFREFLMVYEQRSRGQRVQMPRPRPFRDYISWLKKQDPQAAENYWQEALEGIESSSGLPGVRPAAAGEWSDGFDEAEPANGEVGGGEPRFKGRSHMFSEAETSRLKAFARGHGLTMNTLVQQAWAVLLSRYSQQDDVVFGAVVSGRPPELEGVEETVGLFVNTLPVRVRTRGVETAVAHLKRLQAQQLEMRQYEHSLLTDIQRWSEMPAGVPLFEHILAFENYPEMQGDDDGEGEAQPALTIRGLDSASMTNYPLTIGAFPGEQLDIRLDYYTSHYEDSTIHRLLEQVSSLLQDLASSPEKPLSALSMLRPGERHQVLHEWNDFAVDYPRQHSLANLFGEQVSLRPEAVVITSGELQLTFAEFDRQANRLAHHLLSLEEASRPIRGGHVGIFMERSPRLLIALMAILKAGGAYVPLAPDYPVDRLQFMIQDAALSVLLTEEALVPKLEGVEVPVVAMDGQAGEVAQQSPQTPEVGASGNHLAYVIYTSGSTGLPKGVAVPQQAVARLVRGANYARLEAEMSYLLMAPVSFDASTFEIWAPLLNGGRLTVVPPGPPTLDFLAEMMQRHRITFLWITTGFFHLIGDERPGALGRLDQVLTGGEIMSMQRAREVLAAGGNFVNMYGPTENTTFTTGHPVKSLAEDEVSVSIGRPISNSTVFVADADLQPVPIGCPGELVTGGEGLAWGYLRRPALTAERFVPDPFSTTRGGRLYRTGDLVGLRTDGNIEFIGRFDSQVKIRGFRIEPGEVESAILRHEAVAEAIVVVREDGGEKRLVAYVVPHELLNLEVAGSNGAGPGAAGSSAAGSSTVSGAAEDAVVRSIPATQTIEAVRSALREHLPAYMIPSDFVALEALPLTPNGKINRRALPAPGTSLVRRDGGKQMPRTPTEGLLASVWGEVLDVDDIGVQDDFFELGGHSLSAIQVVSRIRETFGVELPLRELFEGPSLGELARVLERAKDESSGRDRPPIEVAARAGQEEAPEIPLSFAQQRLWFLDQLEPGSPAYNLPMPLLVEGALDPALVAACLGEVVRRHESLRTRLATSGGQPIQVVDPATADEALPVVDCTGLDPARQEREALRLAAVDALRSFDLTRGPLVRATLLRMHEEKWVVLFNMHHIISDGWSLEVLVHEISHLYSAFQQGQQAMLPELPIQYGDYALWQRQWLVGEVLEGELDYWRQQLASAPPVLELPWDRPRPAEPSMVAASRNLDLSPRLTTALRKLGQRQRVTLFMVNLAAFTGLLARYSGQRGVSLGTPVTGRNQVETEPLIGFFVNTLVLHVDLVGKTTFTDLLKRSRDVVLEAHAHQEVPFERLVEEFHKERNLDPSPLFQVMFSLQNQDTASLELPGLRLSPLTVERGVAKFDLTLEIMEGKDQLDVTAEYRTELFDATTIERLLRHYTAMLEAMSENADQDFRQIAPYSPAERHQLEVEWSDSAAPLEGVLVPELFAQRAVQDAQAAALLSGEETLSYGELERRANTLAHHLRGLGVGPETRVALLLDRSPWRVVATLAVWRAGGASVPLDPNYPVERLAFCLADSEPAVVVCAGETPDGLDLGAVQKLDVEAQLSALEAQPDAPAGAAPTDLAYLIYTSGTTGQPKAVMVEHRQLVHTLRGTAERFAFEASDLLVSGSSYAFDIALFEVWAPLLAGGRVRLLGEDDLLASERLAAALEGATLFHAVPSLLRQLLLHLRESQGSRKLESLRRVFVGGDLVPPALLAETAELLPWVQTEVLYGPTETTILATSHPVTEDGVVGHPIGRALPNVKVKVQDRGGQTVPLRVAGELLVGGDGVSRGYFHRPELTAERFVGAAEGRWYRTGDRVRFRADGVLEFLGRTDQQVKVRGFRIEPGEVAAALEARADVAVAVVVAQAAAGGEDEKRLVAYVVAPEGIEAAASEVLREDLSARLPAYMVPSAFVPLDALPLSPTGKVDLQALPLPDTVERGYLAPRTEGEEMISGIWAEVLGVERVGVEDNFFELGGHSLLATQVVSRLRNAFGFEVPLRELFENPTVAELAQTVEGLGRQASGQQVPPLEVARRDGDLPLSFAQQRLWFIDQLEPGLALYNMPFPVRLEGPLNGSILEYALAQVVRRHEVLRTTFEEVEGRPLQRIAEAQGFSLPRIDLTGLPAERRETAARQLAAEDGGRPFDLGRGPMLRASLVELGRDDALLLFNLHHIAGDGWSIEVLTQEISTLYGAVRRGEEAELPELPVQYADFAAWQRGWLSGDVLEGELTYWRDRLGDAPDLLELPTDRPRPANPSFRGASLGWTVPAVVGTSLKEVAQRQGATLFMALLAGLDGVLSHYSGQEDISVGTPMAGRNHLEVEALIGFFVNTLVLRVDLAGSPSFVEVLERARQTALEAQTHQEVPFEKLVEELAPDRDTGHSPLFQVMFAVQNLSEDPPDLGEVKMSLLQGEGSTAKFDLSIMANELADGSIGLEAEYSLDLFDGSTVERLLRHYSVLLEAAMAAPEQPLDGFSLLSPSERHQLVAEWNDTDVDSPKKRGLASLFSEQAVEHAAAVALVAGELHLSYAELAARSLRVASALADHGVGADQRVGLYLDRSAEMVLAILGILQAGGAYVALDTEYPMERLRLMVEDAGLDQVLTSADLEASLPGAVASPLRIESLLAATEESPRAAAQLPTNHGGDQLAYVSYTSGSTGRPKGVAVPQRAVVRLVRGANFADLVPQKTFLQLAPVAFDASTLELWGPLLNGGRLVLMTSGAPSLEALGGMLRRQRVNVLWLTAGLFHLMVDERLEDLAGVEQLLAGGDVLSPERVQKLLAVSSGPRVINGYGPTENTTFTSCYEMVDDDARPGASVPIGRPVSGSRVWILDRHLRPVPRGVFGELMTSGAGLARGYLGNPAGTAERFVPHPLAQHSGERMYKTGDVVRYLPDGRIEFAGRDDQQVKIRGFRIEPGEVEAALFAQPSVTAAVVLVRDDSTKEDGSERRLVAYVVGVDGQLPDPETLRSALAEDLPAYMVPAAIVPLEALPLTANGKLDRKALPVPGAGLATASYVAPRTESEGVIAGIWAEVLGVEQVGVEDSFFDLGGHSLLATQVISRVRGAFNVELPLRELFENPTVSGLSRAIEEARREASGQVIPALEPVPRDGDLPLSFAQQRLWFIDQLEPGLSLYNMPFPVRLEGPLDGAALEYALTEVVRRHEVLRTSFAAVEGRPRQIISPPMAIPLPRIDLTALPAERKESESRRLVGEDGARPFDLEQGPLLRASLALVEPEEALLLFNLHHIAGDGWSIDVLTQEISALYGAARQGELADLPELPVQYADFAAWQRSWLKEEVLEAELDYWRKSLEGAPSLLELPTDRPRPPAPSFRGETESLLLSPQVGETLKGLARRQGATVYMVLLAGLEGILARYCGRGDITVGTPVAGRNRLEVEPLIGFFVNTLVLRVRVAGEEGFSALLKQVREVSLEAQAHQDVPFEKLVEELEPERNPGHSPLFQVMFSQQEAAKETPELGEVKMSLFGGEGGLAKFDLSFMATQLADGGISLTTEYAVDLFDGTSMKRLLDHYGTFLRRAAAEPEKPLAELPLLSPSHRHQLAMEWNDTAVACASERGLASLFAEQSADRPEAVALVSGESHLSYGQLALSSRRVATALMREGVGVGHRVGLHAERSVEMVAALLGILEAGGAYVPLDPDYPAERLLLMIEDAGLDTVLTSSSLESSLPGEVKASLQLESVLEQEATNATLPDAVGGGHLAYVSYTSGSTGRPKGVEIPQRAVVRLVQGANFAHLGPKEVFLQMAPVSFDASTLELWAPLLNGGRLVLMTPGAPSLEALGSMLRQERVTTLWLTAGLFHLMADERLQDLAVLQQLLAGGDVLSPERVRKILDLPEGPQLINGYGPTENTTFTACHPITPLPPGASVPVGRPVSNSEVWIVDHLLEPVPMGVFGELTTSGLGLAQGYLGNPAGTAEKFVPHPLARCGGERMYRTGDLARFLVDGTLEFAGRSDQQVKIRGFRIEPGEIEAALIRQAAVAAAVVVVKGEGGARHLVAYVVGSDGEAPQIDALRSALEDELPPYMVPSVFMPLEALPLTLNGKVDRKALPEPDAPRASEAYVAPRTEGERLMAGIWADVLDVERVGTEDSFFELGGHSLLATQVIARVRGAFGVDLPLRELFENPTVAGLSRAVDTARQNASGLAAPPLEPVPRDGDLPLSFAQQRQWFIDQLEPGMAVYNMPFPVRLEGPLRGEVMEAALSAVVRRHDVLRTRYVTSEGTPRQVVDPFKPFSLPRVDLTALPEERREPEGRRLAAADGGRPFDLEKGPILRAALVQLQPEECLLLFNLHHIAGDGWSIDVLTREISALYDAGRRGEPAELPPLPVQYADFASWQRGWLAGEVLEKEIDHWRDRLQGAPALLELPTDRPRPSEPSFRGNSRSLNLSLEVSRALKDIAQKQGATLFMVLLAGLDWVLSRTSGQDDLSVGTPVAGRNRTELEPLIGFFVNTLVLRVKLEGSPSFLDVLGQVREVALDAQTHQDLPFEKMVEELEPDRNLAHSPLFQVMFTVQNLAEETPELGEVKMSLLMSEGSSVAKFDLSPIATELASGEISLGIEYAVDLFDGLTVERMLQHFSTLLEGVVEDQERPLVEFSMLSAAERHQVAVEWNDVAAACPMEHSLPRLFAEQVASRPEAVAVVLDEQQLSYRELAAHSHRVAAALRARRVADDGTVGLFMDRSVEMVVATLGILEAGAAYVPLDPEYPEERLRMMIEDSGLQTVVTTSAFAPKLPDLEVLELDKEGALAERGEVPAMAEGGDRLAYVMYTSGSTGRPKGVAVPHRGIVRLVKGATFAEMGPEEVFLQLAPISFDLSTLELWGPLLNGGRVVLMPPGVPALEDLGATLWRQRISILWLTAGLFHLMVDEQAEDLQALGQLLAGGDVLSPERVRRVLELPRAPRMIDGYGPTENTTFTSCHGMGDPSEVGASVSIGRPVTNSEVWIVDRALRPVLPGVFGELVSSGAGLARGYLGRPALTAERFVPHPLATRPGDRVYRTGDVARHLPDGLLEFSGRVDHQVKLRGFRIEPGEIEAALRKHPAVAAAFVMVREDAGDRRLVAYLVGRGDPLPDSETLRTTLQEELPSYMVPAAFVPLDALPLSPNGKVDRKALPAPGVAAAGSYIAPRSENEGVIAGIWAEVLGAERVGAEDSFFELGGHSLLATQVISRLRRALGVEVPLRALFESPTVAGLARAVEVARREASGVHVPPLERAERGEDLPLSFAQQRLWFIDRLEPGLSLYNMPFPVRLEGPLDAAVLEHSLVEIMRRHEVLRTTFIMKGELPCQQIAPEVEFHLPQIDLQGLPEEEREPLALLLAAADGERPFNLAEGPVLRASLVLLAPEEAILLFNLHHIAGDGWSIDVLVQEVSELYLAIKNGEAVRLPELPVQYADFSVWQRGWLSGDVLEAEISYWRDRLSGKPPLLELPSDRPRPTIQSFRGATRSHTVSAETGKALQDLARAEGSTLFMVVLAGLQWTLAHLSGQKDISVGTPVAGRNRLELEPLIGFFVNTLVLRVDLSGTPSFVDVLRQVREVALEAQSHQDVPFEKLVDELEPERALGRSPLYQVMFAFQNLAQETPELGEVKVRPLDGEGSSAKFDLSVSASEAADGGLILGMEYAVDLFDGTTIDRWLQSLVTLLGGAVQEPQGTLADVSLLAPAERHQVQVEWNDVLAAQPEGNTLPELFSDHAAHRGDAVALVRGDLQVSYGELAERAGRVAGGLLERGVQPDGLVGICVERSVEMVVAKLGILLAGQGFVPLDPTYPEERLRWLIEDAGLQLVVTHPGVSSSLPETAASLVQFDELASSNPPSQPVPTSGDRVAYVMYTSGSTGRPKGVAVTQGGVVRLVCGPNYADLGPQEVFLHLAPVSFDASTFELWGALLNGARLVLHPPGLPVLEELGASLTRDRVSTVLLTTGLFHLMADERPADLTALRQLLTGGDVLSPERARKVLSLPSAPRLLNAYGPTENAVMTTYHGMSQPEDVNVPVPIGRPVSNSEVWIVDRGLQPVTLGTFGELLTSGVGLARGYLGRPALTAERFVPNPAAQRPGDRAYRTGDLARFLPEGSIEFAGRFDHQVKLRGFRIEPGEIEAALVQQKGVAAAFVMVHQEAGQEMLVAYVVGSEGKHPDGEALRTALRGDLPPHMVPGVFIPLDALPLTPNGKLDRDALPAPEMQSEGEAFVAPRDQVERDLAVIWQDLLGVEKVGVHDNFFALGGHSLLGIQLLSRVQKALGEELPVAALFKAPTIGGMASILRGEGNAGLYDSLMPFETDGSQPPLYFIHPGGGMVFFYRDLVERVSEDRPAYGLQSQGLEGGVAPFDTIEAMASHYIEEIQGVQPEGPYHFVGWSMGGVIAFEMARQLVEAGEKVAFLGLIDSRIPTVFDRIGERDEMVVLERFAQNFGLPLDIAMPMDEFVDLSLRERLEYVLERARELGDLPENLNVERVLRYYKIFQVNSKALSSYQPGPYQGKMVLLKASKPHPTTLRNPDASWFDRFQLHLGFLWRWLQVVIWDRFVNSSLGWGKIEGCSVEPHHVPGDHFSMLMEPHVENLAEELKQALEGLQTED